MEIATAVVLAHSRREPGLWTQLGVRARYLLPVANQPVLCHNMAALSAAGLRDVALVVDAETAPEIRAAVGDGSAWDLRAHYVEAHEPLDALAVLRTAEQVIEDHPFVVHQGDVLLRDGIRPLGARFVQDGLDALALELPTSRGRAAHPGALRLASVNGAARTADVVGACFLRPRAVARLGERAGPGDLDALVESMTASGGRVAHERVAGCFPCQGERDGLLAANRQMLEHLAGGTAGASIFDSEIQGRVLIGHGASLHRTLVRGPAVIGPGARLSHAYVGPYTSIGHDVVIEGAEIEHSIVLPEAELSYLEARVESSIIGRRARVRRRMQIPRTMQLQISDRAEVTLA